MMQEERAIARLPLPDSFEQRYDSARADRFFASTHIFSSVIEGKFVEIAGTDFLVALTDGREHSQRDVMRALASKLCSIGEVAASLAEELEFTAVQREDLTRTLEDEFLLSALQSEHLNNASITDAGKDMADAVAETFELDETETKAVERSVIAMHVHLANEIGAVGEVLKAAEHAGLVKRHIVANMELFALTPRARAQVFEISPPTEPQARNFIQDEFTDLLHEAPADRLQYLLSEHENAGRIVAILDGKTPKGCAEAMNSSYASFPWGEVMGYLETLGERLVKIGAASTSLSPTGSTVYTLIPTARDLLNGVVGSDVDLAQADVSFKR